MRKNAKWIPLVCVLGLVLVLRLLGWKEDSQQNNDPGPLTRANKKEIEYV